MKEFIITIVIFGAVIGAGFYFTGTTLGDEIETKNIIKEGTFDRVVPAGTWGCVPIDFVRFNWVEINGRRAVEGKDYDIIRCPYPDELLEALNDEWALVEQDVTYMGVIYHVPFNALRYEYVAQKIDDRFFVKTDEGYF